MNTVFFDLDGTLLPMDAKLFEKTYFKGLCKTLPDFPPEKLIEYIWAGTKAMVKNDGSRTNRDAFAETFSRLTGMDFETLEPLFEEYYRTAFQDCRGVCPVTDISRSIIHTLKEKGYRIVIATNPIFPQIATYSRLDWLGLSPDEFELVTTYENSSHAKPNPAYYEEILKKLSLQPADCIMIGNDVFEDGIAASLGIPVTLVTDCLINTKELPTDSYATYSLQGVLEWAEKAPGLSFKKLETETLMYYIFVNPSSRSGKGITVWDTVKAYLNEHHITYELYFTKENCSTRPEFDAILAKDTRELIPLLVIGGDGTLNQCINGISTPERFELSYVPAGSGNDFSRNKNLPATVTEKLDSIFARTNERLIDIGTAELSTEDKTVSRNFIVSSGIGYDAEICEIVNASGAKEFLNRIRLGKLIYMYVGVKNIFDTKTCDLEITVDGVTKRYNRVYFAASMNQPYEGGGLPMVPDAVDNDGKLGFLVFHDLSVFKALALVPKISSGKHVGRHGVTILEGTDIVIRSEIPKAVHCDGECTGSYTQCHITINKKIKFIY